MPEIPVELLEHLKSKGYSLENISQTPQNIRDGGGSRGRALYAECSGQPVVLKWGDNSRLGRESDAMHEARGILPVPGIVYSNKTPEGIGYILMERVDGIPLKVLGRLKSPYYNSGRYLERIEELAGYAAKLHRTKSDKPESDDLFNCYIQKMRKDLEGFRQQPHSEIKERLMPVLEKKAEDAENNGYAKKSLSEMKLYDFTHGDLTDNHAIVSPDGRKILSIIDWEFSSKSDRHSDLPFLTTILDYEDFLAGREGTEKRFLEAYSQQLPVDHGLLEFFENVNDVRMAISFHVFRPIQSDSGREMYVRKIFGD